MKTLKGLAAVFALALPTLAHAQLSRVYASEANGKDNPPCGSLQKPCQTLAYSISKAAAGGTVILLDSGQYGPGTITTSLTVEAAPGARGAIEVLSSGILITAASTDVVILRGLTLKGTTTAIDAGVSVGTAGSVHVENCVVTQFFIGIRFNPSNGRLFVKDTIVRNNGQIPNTSGGSGIWVVTAHPPGFPHVSIDHSRIDDNAAGVYFNQGVAVIRNSTMSGNDGFGLGAVGPGASGERRDITVEDSVMSNNHIGIYSSGGNPAAPTRIRVSRSTVTGNTTGLQFGIGGEILTRGNNTLEGNDVDGVFSGVYLGK